MCKPPLVEEKVEVVVVVVARVVPMAVSGGVVGVTPGSVAVAVSGGVVGVTPGSVARWPVA